MLIRIPPKYSVAEVIGYIKGKSAIVVARQFGGRKRNVCLRQPCATCNFSYPPQVFLILFPFKRTAIDAA